jgi:hypothetical protein
MKLLDFTFNRRPMEQKPENNSGAFMDAGLAIGIGVEVAMDNIGMTFGAAFTASQNRKP